MCLSDSLRKGLEREGPEPTRGSSTDLPLTPSALNLVVLGPLGSFPPAPKPKLHHQLYSSTTTCVSQALADGFFENLNSCIDPKSIRSLNRILRRLRRLRTWIITFVSLLPLRTSRTTLQFRIPVLAHYSYNNRAGKSSRIWNGSRVQNAAKSALFIIICERNGVEWGDFAQVPERDAVAITRTG